MAYKVNSLEEMPNALSYLIESVESLQSKVNALQHKQASDSPKWMDIDELCAYLPSHPAKQTVYGWVSTKQIPVHKINKALAFLQSEIDDWLKNKSHKTQNDLMEEARRFVESKKIIRSFFRKPIQNIEPIRAVGIVDVYRYITGHYAQPQTEALRLMLTSPEAKRYKTTHFDYCTFSGLFGKRNEKELIMHSGLMCLDFDHVEDIMELKQKLLNHEYFDTELLFVSPSGNGLKWIIPVDLKGWEHFRYFKAVANCIKATGLPLVDMSGSDVARSCFLPHDPQAYINPKYKDDVEENIFRPRLGECPF